jgi:cyclin-dependent kinase 7
MHTKNTPQGHTKLPDYVSVGQFPRTPLRDLFTAASADTLNLLSKCIVYEPRKRIGARDVRNRNPLFERERLPTIRFSYQALNHPYFFALPYPTHPSKLPKTAAQTAAASRPLDEVDGNVDPTSGSGLGVKAAPSKKLKRKLSGHDLSRNIARKLDFTAT